MTETAESTPEAHSLGAIKIPGNTTTSNVQGHKPPEPIEFGDELTPRWH
jgi:hypothetical protein